MVLLHDYRDMKFLKRLSAVGMAASLMSSSGLAYAVSLGWPAEHCAFLAFQTVGAALALYAYLRTYVARAVLCPKRAQLLVTGCSFFGQPRAEDEAIQLSQIRPGYSLEGGYIKFRMKALRGTRLAGFGFVSLEAKRVETQRREPKWASAQRGLHPRKAQHPRQWCPSEPHSRHNGASWEQGLAELTQGMRKPAARRLDHPR